VFLGFDASPVAAAQSVMYGGSARSVPAPPALHGLAFAGWRAEGGPLLTSAQVLALQLLQDTQLKACYSRTLGNGTYLRVSGLGEQGIATVLAAFANTPGQSLKGKGLWTADVALCNESDDTEVVGGGTVNLPYPDEAVSLAYQSYDFSVLHLKGGTNPEFLSAVAAPGGLTVTVDSFSPFAVAYSLKAAAPVVDDSESADGSASSSAKDSATASASSAADSEEGSATGSSSVPETGDPARHDMSALGLGVVAALALAGASLSAFSAAALRRSRARRARSKAAPRP
jgi:hypothetical protein